MYFEASIELIFPCIQAVKNLLDYGFANAVPYLKDREDWNLEDTTGKDDTEFLKTIVSIERKFESLSDRIVRGFYPRNKREI